MNSLIKVIYNWIFPQKEVEYDNSEPEVITINNNNNLKKFYNWVALENKNEEILDAITYDQVNNIEHTYDTFIETYDKYEVKMGNMTRTCYYTIRSALLLQNIIPTKIEK